MSAEHDNVHYIDEYRRERWLLELKRARELGGVAIFNAEQDEPAKVIPFPDRQNGPGPGDAA